MAARAFLQHRIMALSARARRLARLHPRDVGLRAQDLAYAPSKEHLDAANRRLTAIDDHIIARLAELRRTWRAASTDRVLIDIALVEREIDRARRAFGLFFELFSQRGSAFAPTLAAHDIIAADCYAAIRAAAPGVLRGPLLKPLCYMEHGFSPATMRRGILLNRLLGEANPFPVVRIPWDRDNPWQPVFLHEVSHNLQADLGIWQENRQALLGRVGSTSRDPLLTSIYGRWHKEIFADLAAILLGGPAAAWGMAMFLAQPPARTMTYRPGGAHPTPYLRVQILVEMLRRLGFRAHGERLGRAWRALYDPARFHRLPARLLATADTLIPHVVDEIAFQTRRNLAQHALVDIIPFSRDDQRAVQGGALRLAAGRFPDDLPPRHLVSAAQYALETGRVAPASLSGLVIHNLNERQARASRDSKQSDVLAA